MSFDFKALHWEGRSMTNQREEMYALAAFSREWTKPLGCAWLGLKRGLVHWWIQPPTRNPPQSKEQRTSSTISLSSMLMLGQKAQRNWSILATRKLNALSTGFNHYCRRLDVMFLPFPKSDSLLRFSSILALETRTMPVCGRPCSSRRPTRMTSKMFSILWKSSLFSQFLPRSVKGRFQPKTESRAAYELTSPCLRWKIWFAFQQRGLQQPNLTPHLASINGWLGTGMQAKGWGGHISRGLHWSEADPWNSVSQRGYQLTVTCRFYIS